MYVIYFSAVVMRFTVRDSPEAPTETESHMPTHAPFPIHIDGERIEVESHELTGEQLRALIAPRPESVWLDVDDAMDRLIATDQVIRLDEDMHFFTDRARTIYIDGVPFVVRSAIVSAEELRALPTPPVSDELGLWKDVIDDLDDPIAVRELVRVADGDRFFTKILPVREYHIIVNVRRRTVDHKRVTYDEIVAIAYPSGAPSDNITFTVTYTRAAGPHPDGTLAAGGSVLVKEGTNFNVRLTDKS